MKMQLESVLVSGNNFFMLMRKDGVLHLRAEEFTGLDSLLCVKKSFQPDMIIPPEETGNFAVDFYGEFIVLKRYEHNEINHMIRSSVVGEHVCFYIDTERKLLVHVQPVSEDYNFDTYQYSPIVTKTPAELEAEILSMKKHEEQLLESLVDGLDSLAQAESKLAKDTV